MSILLIFTRIALVLFAGVITFFHIGAATASLRGAMGVAGIGGAQVPFVTGVPFVSSGFTLVRFGFAFALIALPLVAIYFVIRYRKNNLESARALFGFTLFLAGAMPAVAPFWSYRGPFYAGLALFALFPLVWALRRHGAKLSGRRLIRSILAPAASGAVATIIVWTAMPPRGYSGMTVEGNNTRMTVTYTRSPETVSGVPQAEFDERRKSVEDVRRSVEFLLANKDKVDRSLADGVASSGPK